MAVIEAPVNTPGAWSIRARAHAEPWIACGWSRDGQLDRLEHVVDALDPRPGERLLDWGCGTGELCELLPDDVVYVGFDWSDGMVERAIRDHAADQRRFVTGDPAWKGCDLVACVGPFNLPDGWSKQRTWHTLRHLWDVTGCRALAVSLYCGDDPNCLSYDLEETYCAGDQLSWDVEVTPIRANDLLMVARR